MQPGAALVELLSLCAREPSRLQSVGSFVRLSLRSREQWLRENVSGGLQPELSAQVGLAIAQVYSERLFTGRCYQYLALATRLHEFFDFSRGCVHVTLDGVRFRVRFILIFYFLCGYLALLPLMACCFLSQVFQDGQCLRSFCAPSVGM